MANTAANRFNRWQGALALLLIGMLVVAPTQAYAQEGAATGDSEAAKSDDKASAKADDGSGEKKAKKADPKAERKTRNRKTAKSPVASDDAPAVAKADKTMTATTTPPAPAAADDDGPTGQLASSDEGDLYRCKNLPRNAKFKVTLKPETELKDLVNWAMSFTCRNFIFGQGIMGRASKVTIIAPNEMTPAEAWNLFLVSLQTMNLNVVPKGRTLEIVESQTTKEKPLPVYQGGGAPNSDQIVRAVVRPQYMTIDDATQVMNTLKSKDGLITPLPNAGVIIVTDYGTHIARMTEMMRTVDAPLGGDRIFIIPVRYADAVNLGQKLNEIFGARAGTPGAPANNQPRNVPAAQAGSTGRTVDISGAAPTKILPDERSNSLIVIGSEAAYQRTLALVKRLDESIEGGTGGVYVYALENGDAEEMSNTLNSVISGAQRPTQGAGGPRGGQAPQAQANAGGGAGGAAFEGQIRVTFDKPTNSLVIVSSAKDYVALRSVVRNLDVPRRQVFVEATIVEVSLDKTRRMGFAFHGGAPYKDGIIVGGVQHSDLGTLQLNPSQLIGGIAGGFGPEITEATQILGFALPSVGVMFQFLQNNNDVNVLSSPHILTTDNVPAEINVGQNIPVLSGQSLGSLGGAAAQQTGGIGFGLGPSVQRTDVGLKLKITPHVNESDMVRLELEQEINDIASENFGGNGASWTKRSVKTAIVVKDQSPVVIGGLMSDKTLINESKVPLLGDIPILGYLFKYKRQTKTKTNLLIFLTPYVIKDQTDIRKIFDRKLQERREFMRSYTMFQDPNFEPDVDFGRKRGLVEDINRAVRLSDEDEQLLREVESKQSSQEVEGPIEFLPAKPAEEKPEGGAPQNGKGE